MGDLQGSHLGPGGLWGSLDALPVSLTEVWQAYLLLFVI